MLFGGGLIIYALMFLVWNGMITYGFIGGLLPQIVLVFMLLVIALIAGSRLRLEKWRDILPYSVSWAVMIAALDAVFIVPMAGWELYADINAWLGYALVAVIPAFAPALRGLGVRF